MRALVWFRADLRWDDNRALYEACTAATRGVVGVFTLCPRQWRQHDWADTKVELLLRSLACLTEQLRKRNIPLRLIEKPTFAHVPAALLKLAKSLKCDALYFNREYEVNERRRDEAVARAFEREGLRVEPRDDQTILPPDSIQTKEGRFYTVFTPFKRTWMARLKEMGGGPALPSPRAQTEMVCATDALPEQIKGFDLSQGQPESWPAGEKHALRQLTAFIERRVARYGKDRDLPGIAGTSRLSPYLTLGVLSPRRCLAEAAEANGGKLDGGRAGPSTWISELIWREFYRHVLVGFPRVSMGRAFRAEWERLPWREHEGDFLAWCAGRTGFPIVDAGMRQLTATGWMHNRVRMITAMFLAKDLRLDWRLGERHFMRHLVDGDLASNNGGWQWSASTGTDAAPYFRIFNPYSQSRKFDPAGEYIRRWVPELRDVETATLHDPKRLPDDRRAERGYPNPICNHAEARTQAIAMFRQV